MGNDVWLVATHREDAVDAFMASDVLTERCDILIGQHSGIEGVATLLRSGCSMSRAPMEFAIEVVNRNGVEAVEISVGRVDHHGSVDPFECAAQMKRAILEVLPTIKIV